MAAIFNLSLPVNFDSTDNMDDMSSELKDLGNTRVAFGITTMYRLQAYIKCTVGLAAAILDFTLPVLPTTLTVGTIYAAS